MHCSTCRVIQFAVVLFVALFALSACGEPEDPEITQNDNQVDPNDNDPDDNDPNDNDPNDNDPNDNDPNDNDPNDNDCPADCDPGETRCSGSELETCVTVDGCPVWADGEACDGEQVCSGGECVDECDDVCDEGDTECDGTDGVRTCELQDSGCYDWSSAESCPDQQWCDGGECQGCDDGDQRCAADGSAIEQCNGGVFEPIQSCPIGCEDAQCVDEIECTPGDYQCTGNVVEVCNSTGTAYLYVATCAVDCEDGLCTGECEPGAQRCNEDDVEVCNAEGTAWELEDSCEVACEPSISDCVEDELSITSDSDLSGTVYVDGPVTVHSGADLHSPEGELEIIAQSITIEQGASISLAATGDHPDGHGGEGCDWAISNIGGGGASHAAQGEESGCDEAFSPAPYARDDEIDVTPGARGGDGANAGGTTGTGGMGGGLLALRADEIDIAGTIYADGEDGNSGDCSTGHGAGGSGGGVRIAADDLAFSGTAFVRGGEGHSGTCNTNSSGDGGDGFVKFLYGAEYENTGTVNGVLWEGLLAPMEIFSSTHPDPQRFYNDDFDSVALSWERPFTSVDGYYQALNTTRHFVPDPADASFTPDEVLTYPREDFVNGTKWFHITAVDAQANVGPMESRFPVNVNTLPPMVESSSHPDETQWSDNTDVFMEWSDQRDESHFTGYYYTVDQYGDTVPTEDDTYKPADEKQELLANQEDGIWAFHIVPVDTMGYLTREASTYRFRIGDDPGSGNILGSIQDENGLEVYEARLTINRGLLNPEVADQYTDSNGSYNFGEVPAGDWELRITADGYETKVVDVTVDDGSDSTVEVTLQEE